MPIPGGGANPPYAQSADIVGLAWDQTGLAQRGPGSDMWPLTWADDDLIYTTFGDGGGINGDNTKCRTRLGVQALTGAPASFTASNILGRKSDGSGGDTGGTSDAVCDASYANPFTNRYGDGIIAIGSTLYLLLTDNDNSTSGLAYSTNYGQTWTILGWTWGWPSNGNWLPYGFVHFGKANADAIDSYLYVVGGEIGNSTDIFLARVPVASIGTQGSYQWYTSADPDSPTWGTWANRQPIFTNANNGYSGGIYYFPVLGKYIMPASHGDGTAGNLEVQKCGIFDAPNPWGPFTTVYYSDNWLSLGTTMALQYGIAQKWTSGDDLTFHMNFSSTGSLDSWNLVMGTFTLAEGGGSDLVVDTTSLPDGEVAYPYDETLSASGGTAPYSWSLVSGSLPDGLALTSDGHVTGSPTTEENPSFTVRVTDADGNYDDQVLSIDVGASTGYQEWTAEVDGPDVVNLLISHLQIIDQLVAGQIAAGAVGADEVVAKSMAAKHLVVADFSNIASNPLWPGGDTTHWDFHSAGASVVAKGASGVPAGAPNAFVAKIGAGTYLSEEGYDSPMGDTFHGCTAGEEYFVSIVWASDATAGKGNLRIGLNWKDADGADISNTYIPALSGDSQPWVKASGILTAPAGAVSFRCLLVHDGGTAGFYYVVQPTIRRAAGGEVIVDGSLLARHVGTNELISETANIKDLVVNTAKIGDNAVTVPVSAFTSGQINIPNTAGLETTIQSATITTHGGPVHIIVSFYQVQSGVTSLYVYEDANMLVSGSAFTTSDSYGLGDGKTFSFVAFPDPGVHTYYAKLGVVSGFPSTSVANRSMILLETMK